jgi:hypothetical protein
MVEVNDSDKHSSVLHTATITAVKSFTVQALALDPYPPNVLEANVMKLFTALSYNFLK